MTHDRTASAPAVIVGGGIAGLATALALQRRGIGSVVLERVPDPPDGGLGLNLPGNAVAALAVLGLAGDLEEIGAPVERREYRSARGRLLFAVDEIAFWGSGTRPRCVPRSALHVALRRRVAGSVRLGADVRHVGEDIDGVEANLADGEPVTGSVLVGCDGVHSTIRALVTDRRSTRPAVIADASWRFAVPDPGLGCWTAWTGRAGTVVCIPMGAGRLYGWLSARAGVVGFEPAAAAFAGFPPMVRRVLAAAAASDPPPLHSPLEEVRPAVWTSGRIVLTGDAAHATAPVWAQGAASALEDALVLAELLEDEHAWAQAGLAFARRRRARIEHVQSMTDRFARVARLPPWLRDLTTPVIGPLTYRATYEPLKAAP